MKKYLFMKYMKVALVALVLFVMGYATFGNFNDAMFFLVAAGFMLWMALVIALNKMHSKWAVPVTELFVSLFFLMWYVFTLKPVRRWLKKRSIVGVKPDMYAFLPLYGGLLDTHAMMGRLSSAFSQDKTPAVRAALWRLLTRNCVRLGTNEKDKPVLLLGEWKEAPTSDLDKALELALYRFMEQSAGEDGRLRPKDVRKAMTSYLKPTKDGQRIEGGERRTFNNQYRFADLLGTQISTTAYTKRDIRNIYGMRRMLKALPSSYEKCAERQVDVPVLNRVWPEYMTFSYLFGIEKEVWKRLSAIVPASAAGGQTDELLKQLQSSRKCRSVLAKMMDAVSYATPKTVDRVSSSMGRFSFAWHFDEIFD